MGEPSIRGVVNSQSFTQEQVRDGELAALVKYLTEYGLGRDELGCYMDVHISSDGFVTTVDWVEVVRGFEDVGRFEYVGEDDVVMTEARMPDGSTRMVTKGDEPNEVHRWLQSNPGWSYDPALGWSDGKESE